MFYDTARRDHGMTQDPLTALVVPRPIGWISTLDGQGRVNLAPYSFYNGVAITYDSTQQTWERVPINQTACPDPNQPPAPLTPRDSGYTMGVVRLVGGDRLLLLGGDQAENNVS